MSTHTEKQALRTRLTQARRALRSTPARKQLLDDALTAHTAAFLRTVDAAHTNIAAYNPLPSEPGPADFADQLREHSRLVFVPISLPGGVLAWAVHGRASESATGVLGITEPAGARFTSNVLSSCGALVVPALGVDRRGMRLGKGAGYYDRALATTQVPTAAVVYDDNVVDAVPHDAHDVPVDAVITPSGWWWATKN